MLTTLKYRRHVAVLAILAMVASVMVVAPAVAVDPKADYGATFDACIGVESSDFEDVPAGHSNAGDIDCIAYYGVTRGTGDGNYSPAMSVTREHMALFLTRLAGLVGIDMAADPADAGFTDIGELDAESQTAINQLADLDITQGTGGGNYSPGDSVKRGHMALFIARLMDHMDPMANGDTAYGNIPEDVVNDDMNDDDPSNDKIVKSPFTDLQGSTKEAYDAITALWELGVASGISATSYAPDASITRAAMAEFMAGVLDHSNARPAGVTMQTTLTEDFGTGAAVIAVSYRDDSFGASVDQSLKIFDTDQSGTAFNDDGECATEAACSWSDSEDLTDDNGNVFIDPAMVSTAANAKAERTWYAWMGDEENTKFVKGESGEASVTLTAKPDALDIMVSASLPKEVATTNPVSIAKDKTVVVTAQLVDSTTAADAKPVAKSGVDLTIAYTLGGTPVHPSAGSMKTDDNGQVMFTITSPDPDGDDIAANNTRVDAVQFSGDVDKGTAADTASSTITINWTDAEAAAAKANVSVPDYAVLDSGKVSVRITVSYFDQFGNAAGQGGSVGVTLTSDKSGDGNTASSSSQTVNSRGVAGFRGSVIADAGSVVTPTFQGSPPAATSTSDTTTAVRVATKDDDNTAAAAAKVYAEDDVFRFTAGTHAGILYSYDSGDTFISSGGTVDIDKFEEMAQAENATIQVLTYTVGGASIFIVG